MDTVVKVFPDNRVRINNKYGIESKELLVIENVEDLFCDVCGGVFKPMWISRRFRAEGRKIVLISFVAKCFGCDRHYACNSWVERLWIRTEQQQGMVVIEHDFMLDTLPTMKRDCSVCGPTMHVYYSVQIRSSDEPETTFYRCKKCGRSHRENV